MNRTEGRRNEGERQGISPFLAPRAVAVSVWGDAPGIEQEDLMSPKEAILLEFYTINTAPLGLDDLTHFVYLGRCPRLS